MITINFDGCAEPQNPGGHLGFGVLITEDNVEIFKHSGYVSASPSNTNNIAEYMGLIEALKFLVAQNKTEDITIVKGDSMLVIKQMAQQWAIKNGAYVPYAKECLSLINRFPKISLQWISRDFNTVCDKLSKKELISRGITITNRDKNAPKINHPKLNHDSTMPYGRYKGTKMGELSSSYLLWLYEQEWCKGAVKDYIEDNFLVPKQSDC